MRLRYIKKLLAASNARNEGGLWFGAYSFLELAFWFLVSGWKPGPGPANSPAGFVFAMNTHPIRGT